MAVAVVKMMDLDALIADDMAMTTARGTKLRQELFISSASLNPYHHVQLLRIQTSRGIVLRSTFSALHATQ